MFSHKMGNFINKNLKKKLFPLGEKRENIPKKGPRFLWGPPFSVPYTGRGLEKI